MSLHDSAGDDDVNTLVNVGVVVVRLLNFYKNWSKVEFPTNLRNKAAPPPPGGHPSTTTWNPHFYLLFFLLAGGWYWYFLLVLVGRVGGWSKHRCRVLTDHGLQSASWTKISSQQAGQRGGRHCGHHGGQSVGHVARTKKTPENSADKIIGHCGIVTKVQGWSLWTLSYFWTKVVMLQKDPKSSFNSTDICKFGSPKICKKNINYYVLFWFATYHGKTCNWPG